MQEKQVKETRSRWYLLAGFVVVVILLYFWLDWQINLRKSRIGVIE
jgi:hypothetical protein